MAQPKGIWVAGASGKKAITLATSLQTIQGAGESVSLWTVLRRYVSTIFEDPPPSPDPKGTETREQAENR